MAESNYGCVPGRAVVLATGGFEFNESIKQELFYGLYYYMR